MNLMLGNLLVKGTCVPVHKFLVTNVWNWYLSQLGKRLIAKCRKLIQENEELGKMISSGSIASLEADVAYHKRLLTEAYETEKSILKIKVLF